MCHPMCSLLMRVLLALLMRIAWDTAASSTVWLCSHAGYSTLQGPVTCMVRPHPAVWRFIHGVLLAYLLLLVFLLFQDVGNARQFLKVRCDSSRSSRAHKSTSCGRAHSFIYVTCDS